MSFTAHVDNKKRNISIRSTSNTRIRTYLSAEKMYSINFTVTKKNFCLRLHYNGANSYLFVNGTEIYEFKAKESEISLGSVCLGNISKNWSVDNMNRPGFTCYVYDFSVDYRITLVDDIKDIHKYLMKKYNMIYDMILYV